MKSKNYLKFYFLISLLIYSSVAISFAKEELNEQALRIQEIIKYLASDELEGRYPGSPGIEKAKEYILNHFKSNGLKSINNNYLQSFDVSVGCDLGKANDAYFNLIIPKPGVPLELIKPVKKSWKVKEDWMPSSLSENGAIEAPLVFAGYGITAKDLKYDDYENIDVKDKIVIVLSNSPDGEKDAGSPFAGYTSFSYKAMNARNHGAKGIMFVKIQGDSANVFEPLVRARAERNSGIIAIQAKRTSIASYFPNNSLYPTEVEINKTRKPKSFEIPNTQLHIEVELVDVNKETFNIYGIVEGTDPNLKNEYIVVGAHYDHLGWGGPNSMYKGKVQMIHNGADDNASGTAGLLELARLFANNPQKRSLLFVAFSGEEEGLFGSSHFVNNPPIPLDKISAMVNMDMIGRLQNDHLLVIGVGSSSRFEPIIDSLDAIDSLSIGKTESSIAASDQTSFYLKNIPSIMFFTGVHADYHRPSDDWEKINYNGESKVIGFIQKFIETIANQTQAINFRKIEETGGTGPANHNYRTNVWFGIVPNFEDEPLGFKIAGVSPGSPAEKAGLNENDIIIKIENYQIKNINDFMYSLREFKAGDTVKVIFLRDGKQKEAIVKLVAKE
jgi:hypothetical protein